MGNAPKIHEGHRNSVRVGNTVHRAKVTCTPHSSHVLPRFVWFHYYDCLMCGGFRSVRPSNVKIPTNVKPTPYMYVKNLVTYVKTNDKCKQVTTNVAIF